MPQKRNSTNPAKGEANANPKVSPMEKFKGLTRQLLGVSRDRLKAELERHEKAKIREKR